MKTLAFDTETHSIRPGMLAPRLVCSSWSDGRVLDREQTLPAIRDALQQAAKRELLLVGHNIAYDFGVVCAEWPELIPLVFAALDADGVSDTLIRHMLHDIAKGTVSPGSLADLSEKYLGKHLEKENTWRLRYWELDGRPLASWPPEALEYARKDAETTLAVWHAQKNPADEFPQVRAA